MNVAHVIPITKNIPHETLSYFSAKPLAVGMIVTIPVRKKMLPAIVVELISVSDQKSSLKSAHFNVRKIEKIIGYSPFHSKLLKTAVDCAPHFATSPGAILRTLIPSKLLEKLDGIAQKEEIKFTTSTLKSSASLFQAPSPERISYYKTLIRESFARKQSVVFVVPTKADALFYEKEFAKGIEDYVVSYHSDLTQKQFDTVHKKVTTEIHPLVIIGTPAVVSLYRKDLHTIIIEQERSQSYKTQKRPHLDLRLVIEHYARLSQTECIIGDSLLRTETLYAHDQKEYENVRSLSFRIPELADIKIENLKTVGGTFNLFSKPLRKVIENIGKNKERIFLYVPRKGLAPITQCRECGTSVTCTECNAPLVLYVKKTERVYTCNRCGHSESSERNCKNCQSWNLVPFGIGSENVHEQVKQMVTNVPVWLFDKEHIGSSKEATRIMDSFLREEFGILVGTDYAVSNLRSVVDRVVVMTLDTFFAIPHFRVDETIIGKLITLQEQALLPLLIQTAHADEPILEHVTSGNILQWYRDSLHDRQILRYPPFVYIIAIRVTGNRSDTKTQRGHLGELFFEYDPYMTTVTLSKTKDYHQTTLILKISKESWPKIGQKENEGFPLLEKIRSLSPEYSVEINPDTLL